MASSFLHSPSVAASSAATARTTVGRAAVVAASPSPPFSSAAPAAGAGAASQSSSSAADPADAAVASVAADTAVAAVAAVSAAALGAASSSALASPLHTALLPARKRWPRGVANNGNTCFLSATLQGLAALQPFADWACSHGHAAALGGTAGESCVCCFVRDAVEKMVRPSEAQPASGSVQQLISPSVHLLSPRFYPNRQEDAQEFLTKLLGRLEFDCQRLGRPKCSFFCGRLVSRVMCEACGAHSDTFDPFETLSLGISSGISSVTAALSGFLSREKLEGKNAYRCGSAVCANSQQTAVKSLRVTVPPELLAVHLKRFSFRGSWASKEGQAVAVEPILRIFAQPLMASEAPGADAGAGAGAAGLPSAALPFGHMLLTAQQVAAGRRAGGTPLALQGFESPLCVAYELCAVVVHQGWHASSGHYYAWVKESSLPPRAEPTTATERAAFYNHLWKELNDSFVGAAKTFKAIEHEQAYMLYYRPFKPEVVKAIASAAPSVPAASPAQSPAIASVIAENLKVMATASDAETVQDGRAGAAAGAGGKRRRPKDGGSGVAAFDSATDADDEAFSGSAAGAGVALYAALPARAAPHAYVPRAAVPAGAAPRATAHTEQSAVQFVPPVVRVIGLTPTTKLSVLVNFFKLLFPRYRFGVSLQVRGQALVSVESPHQCRPLLALNRTPVCGSVVSVTLDPPLLLDAHAGSAASSGATASAGAAASAATGAAATSGMGAGAVGAGAEGAAPSCAFCRIGLTGPCVRCRCCGNELYCDAAHAVAHWPMHCGPCLDACERAEAVWRAERNAEKERENERKRRHDTRRAAAATAKAAAASAASAAAAAAAAASAAAAAAAAAAALTRGGGSGASASASTSASASLSLLAPGMSASASPPPSALLSSALHPLASVAATTAAAAVSSICGGRSAAAMPSTGAFSPPALSAHVCANASAALPSLAPALHQLAPLLRPTAPAAASAAATAAAAASARPSLPWPGSRAHLFAAGLGSVAAGILDAGPWPAVLPLSESERARLGAEAEARSAKLNEALAAPPFVPPIGPGCRFPPGCDTSRLGRMIVAEEAAAAAAAAALPPPPPPPAEEADGDTLRRHERECGEDMDESDDDDAVGVAAEAGAAGGADNTDAEGRDQTLPLPSVAELCANLAAMGRVDLNGAKGRTACGVVRWLLDQCGQAPASQRVHPRATTEPAPQMPPGLLHKLRKKYGGKVQVEVVSAGDRSMLDLALLALRLNEAFGAPLYLQSIAGWLRNVYSSVSKPLPRERVQPTWGTQHHGANGSIYQLFAFKVVEGACGDAHSGAGDGETDDAEEEEEGEDEAEAEESDVEVSEFKRRAAAGVDDRDDDDEAELPGDGPLTLAMIMGLPPRAPAPPAVEPRAGALRAAEHTKPGAATSALPVAEGMLDEDADASAGAGSSRAAAEHCEAMLGAGLVPFLHYCGATAALSLQARKRARNVCAVAAAAEQREKEIYGAATARNTGEIRYAFGAVGKQPLQTFERVLRRQAQRRDTMRVIIVQQPMELRQGESFQGHRGHTFWVETVMNWVATGYGQGARGSTNAFIADVDGFPRPSFLSDVDRKRLRERRFQCLQCPATYLSSDDRRRHVKSKHDKVRFPCQGCGHAFKYKAALSTHINSAGACERLREEMSKKKYWCGDCGCGFGRIGSLRDHERKMRGWCASGRYSKL